MIYLFYGEDTYSIKKKLSGLRRRFLQSDPTGINITEIDGAKLNMSQFESTAFAMPFLAEKRMVIVKDLLLDNSDNELKKKIGERLPKIPASTSLFFIEMGMPDARGALFKKLNQPKMAFRFDPVTPLTLKKWLFETLVAEKTRMTPPAEQKFVAAVGSDLSRAENELEKLILFVKSQKKDTIEEDAVDNLVVAENSAGIFDFIDNLANKNAGRATEILAGLIQKGENELYIFSMIVYQFRTSLIVADLLGQGANQKEIASKAKIHPFVVGKVSQVIKKYPPGTLEKNYQKLAECDYEMKSGAKEPALALNLLVIDLCR